MSNKLFIIGNGFDLAHNLPTSFNSNFKNYANKNADDGFWELYQSKEDDIWSDFENLLGHPDYNNLEQIFDGYEPDYLSDSESDRDAIIRQAQISGDLEEALYEFVDNAESSLQEINRKPFIEQILDVKGYYCKC